MYFIKESDSQKLLLKRKSIGGKVWLFVLVGLVFFLIGLFLYSIRDLKENVPLENFGILFMLFGGVGFFAGLNAPSQTKKTVPELIEFDNQKGWVKILQTEAGNLVSYIRYEEIEDFYIHVKVETSMNSNTTRSTSKTHYYGVRIRKKDKGEWEVFNSTSKAKADVMLETLKGKVQLQNSSSQIPKAALTDKVNKDVKGQKITVRWKNKGFAGLLVLLGFMGIFSYTFYTIFSMMHADGETFFYFVGGFIALIFLVVIGINLRKMIRNILRVYGITISPAQFEYFEEDNSGVVQKSVVIPTKDIQSISFIFSPSNASQQVSDLCIYTPEDIAKYDSIKSSKNPLSIVKDSWSLYSNQISLDLSSLNAVEKLELERWLQDIIKEKSSVEVL